MFRVLCRWTQLGAKLSPKAPKLRHFGRDLDFHHMASILGTCGPNFSSALPIGSNLTAQPPTWGQPAPKLGLTGRTQCDTLKTCTSTAISNISNFLLFFMRVCAGNFAYTGPPTVSLSCVRLVRRKLDPKLGLSEDQGRASLTPVGFGWPKYAPPLLLYPVLWVRAVVKQPA